MGEGEPAPGIASLQAVRIYIRGVSASVTAADVEKAFCSLGRVSGVELIQTNGRSLAYMNFEPNSDKALAKLFATYNGCTWKGGKLRLEKAKEHYLARLKREWEEDAKLTALVELDTDKRADDSKKLECSNQENTQLRIFFPKLRKVKSLPFKGSGKHKYSFQRIEVPSLPIHFCDCEEHCGLAQKASQKYISSPNSETYEKERKIMHSVMNKHIEMEDNDVAASATMKLATDSNNMDPIVVDSGIQTKKTEDEDSDADNLVTNIGQGGSDDMLLQLKGGKTVSVDQESKSSKLQPIRDGLSQKKEYSQKKQKTSVPNTSEVTLNQKSCPVSGDTINEEKFTLIISKNESSKNSEEPITFGHPPVKSQTELNSSTIESTKGQTWIQKSSWKDLVGETMKSSFSISDVLPGISSKVPKLPKANESITADVAATKKRKAQSVIGGTKSSELRQNIRQEKAQAPDLVATVDKGERSKAMDQDGTIKSVQTSHEESRRDIPKINIGEVCTFMRSAESEKEWSKARTALSGYLKKSSSKTDASKNLKGMPPSRR